MEVNVEGYVIFNTEAEFDEAHEQAKAAAGLPQVGTVSGKPAPQNQKTTNITYCKPHPTNGTVIAYINGGWPENLKSGFDFKTRGQVAEYFPEDSE